MRILFDVVLLDHFGIAYVNTGRSGAKGWGRQAMELASRDCTAS